MRFEISEIIKQDQVMDLVYGNNSVPKQILGRHYVKTGQVITAYHPEAVNMEIVLDSGECFPMDQIERQPLYAVYLQDKEPFHYLLRMSFLDGNSFITEDPYSFPCQITADEEKSFTEGEWVNAYQKIGCHQMTINGIPGMYFAVWAPSARRVSLVGDFNYWNGLIYPMNRLDKSGIYELFLPGLTSDYNYKFEVKTMQGDISLRSDPFGRMEEDGKGDASKTIDINAFRWTDQTWMENRSSKKIIDLPMAVCSVGDGEQLSDDTIYDGNFTHLLFGRHIDRRFSGVSDYSDHRFNFQPPFCGGGADSFRSVIDNAHRHGIGVLMEISLGFHGADGNNLGYFDGTVLYGYSDRRIGFDSERGMWRFCFEKPEVRSLILSSLVFWIQRYHIDGFVFEGITDMICPDINTSNNLDSYIMEETGKLSYANTEFLKQAVVTVRNEDRSVMLIADERPGPGSVKGGMFSLQHGFDLYWDYKVRKNINKYYNRDAKKRWKDHFRITSPIQDRQMESSLLLINPVKTEDLYHGDIDNGMTPEEQAEKKMALVRMTAAYLLGVPGKKAWSIRDNTRETGIYIRRLLDIYSKYPALYDMNEENMSFEWINCVDAASSVVSFIRKPAGDGAALVFAANFSDKEKENWRLGVSAPGRYRLIFSSDDREFGGKGLYRDQDIIAERKRCDFRPYSIKISLPPGATLIFEYITERGAKR
ncbi:MAG: alpha amylase C-terminal domain-containing protein [Eubacterium sp.]|nr:alpha amylase C-terminal domain-containing protein [Eubacterium sp.]